MKHLPKSSNQFNKQQRKQHYKSTSNRIKFIQNIAIISLSNICTIQNVNARPSVHYSCKYTNVFAQKIYQFYCIHKMHDGLEQILNFPFDLNIRLNMILYYIATHNNISANKLHKQRRTHTHTRKLRWKYLTIFKSENCRSVVLC